MVEAVFKGERRRIKTALFLICCCGAGAAPHWLESFQSLWPAITLALLLGGYGLRTVLGERNNQVLISELDVFLDQGEYIWPNVDIVVAARDEEVVLSKLIHHLARLKYPQGKLSIWIIDDGSEDDSQALLRELSKKFPDLNIIQRSRIAGGGKSGALNEALKHVRGEWLLILDADAQLQEDTLERLIPFATESGFGAIQLRKSVINSQKNYLTRFQAMEMAMDALIQQGRLAIGGVAELRGNGQLLKRSILDKCGGFNENTVTDDLDLSFRLLITGSLVGIVWDPPVQEEAVESVGALLRQRQRWAEGGLQRFFDYWPLLSSSKIKLVKRRDVACFFLLQYALPVVSVVDLSTALITKTSPNYWPLSLVAFSISGFAFWRGCNRISEGPSLPSPQPMTLLMAILYLSHWFLVIPWVTLRMALFPKNLVWVKTSHSGERSE